MSAKERKGWEGGHSWPRGDGGRRGGCPELGPGTSRKSSRLPTTTWQARSIPGSGGGLSSTRSKVTACADWPAATKSSLLQGQDWKWPLSVQGSSRALQCEDHSLTFPGTLAGQLSSKGLDDPMDRNEMGEASPGTKWDVGT